MKKKSKSKTERIVVYCDKNTKVRWYSFVVSSGIKNNEDAVNYLLELWEKENSKNKFRIRSSPDSH